MQSLSGNHKIILVLIIFISIIFRIYLYWNEIIQNGIPYLTDTDVVFHLRRAEICIRNYPWLPVFNSYEEYPKGSYYESPPLHAFILATIGYIAGGFKYRSAEFTRWVLIFYPPIISALAIFLLHYLTRLLFKSIWTAHLASLLAASFPIAIQYSYLGNFDHHISDYLGILLYFLFSLKAFDKINTNTTRELIKLTILPGAMLAYSIYVWQASFLHAAILSLSIFIYCLFKPKREIFLFTSLHFFWSCIFLVPGDIYVVLGGVSWNSLAFFSFGQVFLFLALACFFLAFYYSIDPAYYKFINPIKLKQTWILLALIILALYPLKSDITEGIRILTHNPIPWLRSVTESTPILFIYHEFSLYPLLSLFSYGSLLFPIFLFFFYKAIIKNKGPFSWLLIANAGLIYFFLTNAQARFGYPFTIPLSIITAYYLVHLPTLLLKKFKNYPIILEKIIPFTLCIILLIPCRGYYQKKVIPKHYLQLKEVYEWIKNNTEPTSDYEKAQLKPEYSVLADWEFGIPIEYYAQRPTNIDARGPLYTDWSPIARFLLAPDETQANIIREGLGIKYILLADWYASLRIYPEWMNANWSDYFSYSPLANGEEGIVPTEKLIFTVGFQMSEFAGNSIIASNQIIKPALQHYRLVWESSQLLFGGRKTPTSALKLIEYVKGVKLHISGNPGERVDIIGLVITNTGRTFQYWNYTIIPASSSSIIYLPYSTEKKPHSVFIERYYIQKGNKVLQLQNITNDMIENGSTIHLE